MQNKNFYDVEAGQHCEINFAGPKVVHINSEMDEPYQPMLTGATWYPKHIMTITLEFEYIKKMEIKDHNELLIRFLKEFIHRVESNSEGDE